MLQNIKIMKQYDRFIQYDRSKQNRESQIKSKLSSIKPIFNIRIHFFEPEKTESRRESKYVSKW